MRRQIYGMYWFERASVRAVIDLLADNLMFETDFPHATSLSPGPASESPSPRDVMERSLGGHPGRDRRQGAPAHGDQAVPPRSAGAERSTPPAGITPSSARGAPGLSDDLMRRRRFFIGGDWVPAPGSKPFDGRLTVDRRGRGRGPARHHGGHRPRGRRGACGVRRRAVAPDGRRVTRAEVLARAADVLRKRRPTSRASRRRDGLRDQPGAPAQTGMVAALFRLLRRAASAPSSSSARSSPAIGRAW